jgi:hypothetical protein
MSGAPSLSGTAGALISVLDACLTNGFGTVTLDSLVVASNVATGTVSAGHGFTMIGSTVGSVITIAGATPAGLNGTWRIASVPDSTHFTFVTSGISDQTATGTITAVRAPLGFSKVYSGTNKAVYRADDVMSSRLYLRVADDGTGSATYARVRGYESMSDVDTGTGPFPTDAQVSGGLYWGKSSVASSTARAWRLIGDSQGFYLFVNQDGSGNWISAAWVDIPSEKVGDLYRTLIIGGTSTTVSAQGYIHAINSITAGHYFARTYAQTGSAIAAFKLSHQIAAGGMGYAGIAYPAPMNSQFYCAPVDVWEGISYASATALRGPLPGVYAPLHPSANLADGSFQASIDGLPGRTILIQTLKAGATYAVDLDITGPWR